ncbi:MAG TPA: prolyl oligopeptidase family serine peptidase [Steroidobacteraceae bacterium]|jgi:prolyl oligopeptidase|nr:prolyl oligopeptidase family serine peptidase [Steroidobacteraceae bacterium]
MSRRTSAHWKVIRGAFACLAAGVLAAAAQADVGMKYPAAPRGNVVDDYHGTAVADPYRWMEELDSPATRAWVSAEGKLTDDYLAGISGRDRLHTRIAALYEYEKFGVPFQEGGRYYYARNSGHQDQSVLYTTQDLNAQGAVALDPNALSGSAKLIVTGYVPARDGRLLAYGVSEAGSDWTDWRVRDLRTGKDLPDLGRHTKYYEPAFAHDSKGFYYSAFPAPRAGQELATEDLGDAVYYHALGTPASSDRLVFSDPAHADWQYEPHLSTDGRWLVIAVGEGEVGDKGLENIYLVDLSVEPFKAVPVTTGFEAAYIYVGADAGRLYFLTTLDAPNGRIIGIDPLHPERAHWQDVIAHSADAIDLTQTSVTLVDHQLIVRTLHDARSRVLVYGLDGALHAEVQLPGPGTAVGFGGRPQDHETFYLFSDLITPATVYRYDLKSGRSTVFRAPRVAFDPGKFEERQVLYPGKDGTQIPMTLAYARGLKLDGRNPLLLYGYGGFGIPTLPTFNPARIAWLELGGVYAIANIRGGGEYGEKWHRQAIRTHKQVVFDDFIAAAEWLIAQHYTSTPKLAIFGGSNGGLLVGACVTQRPELYGAAVAAVGVMDMLRFNKFGQGAGWMGDYGSPQDAQEFKALRAYSPVHNVHPGTKYPATLIITGDHDTRVMPMHSFKFAASLQAAQAGSAPVLLYLERASGHGGGGTMTQAIDQNADVYAFLIRNLGM